MKTENHRTLGDFLRAARLEKCFSQQGAARRLGLKSGQLISNVERGLCPLSFRLLRKIILLYGLDAKTVIEIIVAAESERILQAWGLPLAGSKTFSESAPKHKAGFRRLGST